MFAHFLFIPIKKIEKQLRSRFFYIVFSFVLIPSFFWGSESIHFDIVVPSYNNEQWVRENIESIAKQTYSNWTLHYINDNSTDKTGKRAEKLMIEFGISGRAKVIHNSERKGALANLYNTIHQCAPNSVIVTVDGDDRLAHNQVLERLATAYANKNIWMTYGSFRSDPPGWKRTVCSKIPSKIAKKNQFRTYKWVISHLRTFYAGLFQKIKKEDLMWQGKFFPTTWDLAMMFPMIEMASKGHFLFMNEVLYIYNVKNPIMDCKIHAKLQGELNHLIRSKPPYKPLKTLF